MPAANGPTERRRSTTLRYSRVNCQSGSAATLLEDREELYKYHDVAWQTALVTPLFFHLFHAMHQSSHA